MQSGLQGKHHQQQQQMNSGLMRYRSAPTSYLASIADDREGYDLHPRPSSPETERIIAQLMSEESSPPPPEFDEIPASSPAALGADARAQEFAPPKHEAETVQLPVMYQNSCRPPLPSQNPAAAATVSEMDVSAASYRAVASMSVDNQAKLSGSNNSNLTRHSSSPAGLFSHPNTENGYGMRRGVADIGSVNGTGGRASFSASTLKGQINFSSGLMTHMSNTGNKRLGASCNAENNDNFNEGHRGSNDSYLTGFPVVSWEDHRVFSEQFTVLKRVRDDDRKMFSGLNALESQHGERGDHAPTLLSRHMSLPKTSAEMASVEKYLQFQDSVPCKIRAKRGCATHPRSIAERVRRTRISERMRKLQELVPNMDKQTSTADMLDLAVEYIKELQKQVNMLAESNASCTCSNNSKS